MKEMVRYGLTLALISILAAGLLSGVNSLTKGRILAQAQDEEQASLKAVLPNAEHFEPVKKREYILYYKASDENGRFIGVAFKADADGYSSTIETMVGMLKDGTITTIKVLSQNETPGLGTRVSEPSFTGQFSNKDIQGLNEVQAITGATISSAAVIDSVKEKTVEIQELLKDEK